MNSFSFSPSDISYLRTALPHCEEAFFAWLEQLDCRNVRLYALEEGSLCFPRVPLIRVEVRTAVVEVCGGGDALRSVRVGHATACDWGCLAVAQPSRLTLAPASCSAAAFVLCLFLGSRYEMAGIYAFIAVPAASKVSHLLLEMRPDNGMVLKNTASKRSASRRLCLLVTRACTPS